MYNIDLYALKLPFTLAAFYTTFIPLVSDCFNNLLDGHRRAGNSLKQGVCPTLSV